MASWFTLDTRLGSISVTLEPPSCFSAEMYAVDLNVAGASDELKVNLGEQMRERRAEGRVEGATWQLPSCTPAGRREAHQGLILAASGDGFGWVKSWICQGPNFHSPRGEIEHAVNRI
eukprot:7106884-Pyramimonas_sp.AAC.2